MTVEDTLTVIESVAIITWNRECMIRYILFEAL